MKDYILPDDWVCKVTEESIPYLNKFRSDIKKTTSDSCKGYKFVSCNGWGCDETSREIISLNILKEYILNEPVIKQQYKPDPELDQILIKLLNYDN